MNLIEKQVDRIIVGLKVIDGLKAVKFVREYTACDIEAPVRGLMAVVSVTDMSATKGSIGGYLSSSVKGEQYAAKAVIRIYAPADENGSGLSEVTSEILSGLKKADSERVITSSAATAIKFDADMNAIYRTVEFEMEFCLCEGA